MSNSANLRKLADENPKAKSILLYKAEIQEQKHEIITNEEKYTKVLNVIDQVFTLIEEQLKNQPEGNYKHYLLYFNYFHLFSKSPR